MQVEINKQPVLLQRKRVYDPSVSTDGLRVLVDRLWPRGVSRTQLAYHIWAKELAPSSSLRNWFHRHPDSFELFQGRYLEELTQAQSHAVDLLHGAREHAVQHGHEPKMTLLYAARNQTHNHAVILQGYLEQLQG